MLNPFLEITWHTWSIMWLNPPTTIWISTKLRWPSHSHSSLCTEVMNMIGAVKHVDKALEAGVDIICAQGGEGGGHTGRGGWVVVHTERAGHELYIHRDTDTYQYTSLNSINFKYVLTIYRYGFLFLESEVMNRHKSLWCSSVVWWR